MSFLPERIAADALLDYLTGDFGQWLVLWPDGGCSLIDGDPADPYVCRVKVPGWANLDATLYAEDFAEEIEVPAEMTFPVGARPVVAGAVVWVRSGRDHEVPTYGDILGDGSTRAMIRAAVDEGQDYGIAHAQDLLRYLEEAITFEDLAGELTEWQLGETDRDPEFRAEVEVTFRTAGGATGTAECTAGIRESDEGSAIAGGSTSDVWSSDVWSYEEEGTIGAIVCDGYPDPVRQAAIAAWRAGPSVTDVTNHIAGAPWIAWTDLQSGRIGIVECYGSWWIIDETPYVVEGSDDAHGEADARKLLASFLEEHRGDFHPTAAEANNRAHHEYEYDDEHGGGRVQVVLAYDAWAVVNISADGEVDFENWYDIGAEDEAKAAAEAHAAFLNTLPPTKSIAHDLGIDLLAAQALIAELQKKLTDLQRPLTVWVDVTTAEVFTSEPDWQLHRMSWPDTRVALVTPQHETVTPCMAATRLRDALDAYGGELPGEAVKAR